MMSYGARHEKGAVNKKRVAKTFIFGGGALALIKSWKE